MKRLIILALLAWSGGAEAYHWENGGNGSVGAKPVLTGYENGAAMFVCRANGIPGKLHPGTGECYVGYHGGEFGYRQYQVLQDPAGELAWGDRNLVTPERLILGGSEDGGRPLHVCRLREGWGISGKLVGGLGGKCYVGYYGSEYETTSYDVLVLR